MFEKKYIFESKSTRFFRLLKQFFIVLLIPLFIYIGVCIWFLISSGEEAKNTDLKYFKKEPDLIAVFTGDVGRISYSLMKASSYSNAKLFITGVYSKNTIDSLVKRFYVPRRVKKIESEVTELTRQNDEISKSMIDIDYLAKNTIENVISTIRYLRTHREIKSVIVISSDYHIPRIKYIFSKIRQPEDQFDINFIGIKSDFKKWRSIKILLTEVYKYLKSLAFLLLWSDLN